MENGDKKMETTNKESKKLKRHKNDKTAEKWLNDSKKGNDNSKKWHYATNDDSERHQKMTTKY